MSVNDCPTNILPNPFTPLAFVSPDVAHQMEVGQYIVISGLSIFIWDLLSNVISDYRLLFKSKLGFPTGIYFLSRLLTLAFVLGFSIFLTSPVENCFLFKKIICWGMSLSMTSTSLLFFFRVKAVYSNKKSVVIGFFCLWLALIGCTMTIPFAVSAGNIGPTTSCSVTSLKAYVSAAGWGVLIHDTAVTLAISIRLLQNSHIDPELHNLHTRTRLIFSGKYLPRFSRTIFQDGLLYYWITVGANSLMAIMIYVPHVSPIYRSMFTVPTLTLSNIMACYVFRHTKLGTIWQSGSSGIQSIPIQFATPGQGMITMTNLNLNSSSGNDQVEGIVVSTTVERFDWETRKPEESLSSNKAKTQLVV
ncbi:hypothetical protein C8J56DRAFT_965087 [Mycena floridula]|nr:hypothetical protein C8J56DRAFT_965087 [Mycena floridula]